MGCFNTKPSSQEILDNLPSNPEEWNNHQTIEWIKSVNNGYLFDLIKPFQEHRISGVWFIKLTDDHLKNELNITSLDLRNQFIIQRNKLIQNKTCTNDLNTEFQINNPNIDDRDSDTLTLSDSDLRHYIGFRHYYGGYNMLLSQTAGLWIQTHHTQTNTKSNHKNVNYHILQQHKDHCYLTDSNIILNGYVSEMEKLNNIFLPKVVIDLCCDYYFEYEHCVFQLAYDIWQCLPDLNKKCNVWMTSYGQTEMDCFTGKAVLSHVKKIYKRKYNKKAVKRMIEPLMFDLIEYGYIDFIAKQRPFIGSKAIINSNKHLYRFDETKNRQFESWKRCLDDKLDRKAWRIGTRIEVYSGFDSWILVDITDIVDDDISVLCVGKINVLKRNDAMIRSTRKFLCNRIKLDKRMRVQVFGNGNNEWYLGEITDIYGSDGLFVLYETNDHKIHTKAFSRWSPYLVYAYFGRS